MTSPNMLCMIIYPIKEGPYPEMAHRTGTNNKISFRLRLREVICKGNIGHDHDGEIYKVNNEYYLNRYVLPAKYYYQFFNPLSAGK